MKRILFALFALPACVTPGKEERYGFIARLGADTVSVESATRLGNRLISDGVDRFPRVRQRHTEIDLADDGRIRRLTMDIHTPSEPEDQRDRRVEVDVTADSVIISKRDKAGAKRFAFATGGGVAMAHVPQMYSLYDLYFQAALAHGRATNVGAGEPIGMRQFYIDREFDRFPLHRGIVRMLPGGKATIAHDWLAGIGDAALDSAGRLMSYSGANTTYKVAVERLAETLAVKEIGAQFAARESSAGGMKQLSVRDTTRASIGDATFTVDYSRPLARGRVLLGDVIAYDEVWRTGANAATQFTTSAPISLAGVRMAAGTYTLWTVARKTGEAELIVNKQTGQWGTGYGPAHNLGRGSLLVEAVAPPTDMFTISIDSLDAKRGTLSLVWGPFKWVAPIVVQQRERMLSPRAKRGARTF